MNESRAYEMLGVCVAKGFGGAYIEVLGGGALGVTIPLSGTYYALLTEDHGLGVYEQENFEFTGEPVDSFWFSFNDEYELTEPLWAQTAKALFWLAEMSKAKGWN